MPATRPAPLDDAALRAWFDDRTAAHAFSGAALAWRDDEPLFAYHGGLAHRGFGIPVDDRTRFAIASVTKLPTAIAALRLVDRGLVRLDQPLIEILPAEQRPRALTREHTLHHLLSHTSGLPDYVDEESEGWDAWMALWDRIPMYHIRRPADLLPLFIDLPAVAPPGERFAYNDAGFVLAGLVIEAVTGRPYADAVVEEVLAPADMVDSGFEALDTDPARLAVGYIEDGGSPERWRSNIFGTTAVGMPDGGMISTPRDLVRLMEALLGGLLVSRASLAAMIRPQAAPTDDPERWGYGCALVLEDGQAAIVGHSGSDPGVSAKVHHHVASGTTIAVLCNRDTGSWPAYLRIAEALGIHDPRA